MKWDDDLSNYEQPSIAAPFVHLMEKLNAVERELLYLLAVVDSGGVAVKMLTGQSTKMGRGEWRLVGHG